MKFIMRNRAEKKRNEHQPKTTTKKSNENINQQSMDDFMEHTQ